MTSAIHLAEDHIIGGCLKDAYVADVIISELEPTDFSHPTNRCIFNILTKLYKENKHIDSITVYAVAQDLGLSDTVTMEILNNLQTLTYDGVGHYVELVKEAARRRKSQAVLNEAQRMLEDGENSGTVIEFIEKSMYSISVTKSAKDFVLIGDSVDDAFEDIKMMRESSSHVMGLASGYQNLDMKTSGFHPGELIILAARPSVGKTSLAVNMASHIARHGHTVGIFSLEMNCKQLTLRMISGMAQLPIQATSAAFLSDKMWESICKASDLVRGMPVYIDDRAGLKALELRSAARRLKKRCNAEIFIVDYLQLMRGDGRENRQQEVSFISAELKAMAKELEVPVIALSQFNRNPEAREGGMPKLSDLRESGSIEQDADVVLFLHDKTDDPAKTQREVDLIIAKQRNGPRGRIPLKFNSETTTFYEVGEFSS